MSENARRAKDQASAPSAKVTTTSPAHTSAATQHVLNVTVKE
jgi:hypothetical protein